MNNKRFKDYTCRECNYTYKINIDEIVTNCGFCWVLKFLTWVNYWEERRKSGKYQIIVYN